MTRVAWMASGALVWAMHFAALYGFTALACARGLGYAVPWFASVATAAAVAAMLVIIARSLPRRGDFESWIALSVAGMALVGIVFEAMPVALVRACD